MFAPRIPRTILLSLTMSAAVAGSLLCPLTVRAAEETKQQNQEMKHQEHMGKMPGSMSQLMKMDPEECFKMMDKEHKGHVTKKDFMKFQEELWKRMDKKHDNRVDLPEFTDQG